MAHRHKRRLAAILAADVAGYSRLMGADEAGTLARLGALRREVVEPALAEHGGRLVKWMGDGLLAEFPSVVDAVACALAIQDRLAEGPLRLRIGINLGDVLVEDDDVYGDGVNVAARLEALAEAGGLCLSGDAYNQVRGRLEAAFEDLGEQRLKNIDRPVRVYKLATAAGAAPAPTSVPLPDKPSIVVLPFDNMSGDPEQRYFSDGISEDLITDLSKLSGLFVIARNSAFAYRDRAQDLRAVSRELGVRYVLEGSVRKAGNRVRINAQLIDGLSGGHVWAERYDGELSDIFALQDQVTRQIVEALAVHLTRSEQRRLGGRGTSNLEAYDTYLRARDLMRRLMREPMMGARELYQRAIELDPAFAAAYAGLGLTYNVAYINQWDDHPEESLGRAYDLARRAVALDPDEPQGHYVRGLAHLWRREHEQALTAERRALELDPNFAPAYGSLATMLHYAGRSEEGLEALAQAMRLDPQYPDVYLHFRGQCLFMLGRYDEAIEALRARIARQPDTDVSRVLLAAALGEIGRAEEAREAWAEVFRVNPDYSLEHRRRILPYKEPADLERVLDGLRKAGIAVDDQPP